MDEESSCIPINILKKIKVLLELSISFHANSIHIKEEVIFHWQAKQVVERIRPSLIGTERYLTSMQLKGTAQGDCRDA